MTDNEIIEMIEKHINDYDTKGIAIDTDRIDKLSLDLLRRKQAEIAQWKEEANKYQKLWCIAVDDIETAKSEAIQEFAERLKNEIISETAYGCDSNQHTGYYDYQIKIGDIPEYIDNLVKEYEKGR